MLNNSIERYILHAHEGGTSSNQKDWDNHLPAVVASNKASKHESTGYSPNFLILGRKKPELLSVSFSEMSWTKNRTTTVQTISFIDYTNDNVIAMLWLVTILTRG